MEDETHPFQKDDSPISHSALWQPTPHPNPHHNPQPEGLQWGSDPNFGFHGFSCPLGTWTEERLVQNLLRNMSNFYTLDPSLDMAEMHDPKPVWDPMHLNGFTLPFQPVAHERLSETPSPASSAQETGDEACTRRASCARARGQRKRKCVQKPGQRLCHCRSEKRRREIIGERYGELCRIVPGLEGHSFTRKYVLQEAAGWIRELVKGNEVLREQLGGMEGGLVPVEDEKFA